MLPSLGRALIFMGVLLVVLGLFLLLGSKIPHIGKLPGDIYIKKGNFTFYFPLTTCLILSILLSLILFIFSKR